MVSEVEHILNQKEVRITPMRQMILQHFLEKKEAIGLSKLEKEFPKSDRITIYRTLKTFSEKGIIHKIENVGPELKYALCLENCEENSHTDQHPHFHCLSCNSITCLESVFIPSLELPSNYKALSSEMTINGTCPKCRE